MLPEEVLMESKAVKNGSIWLAADSCHAFGKGLLFSINLPCRLHGEAAAAAIQRVEQHQFSQPNRGRVVDSG